MAKRVVLAMLALCACQSKDRQPTPQPAPEVRTVPREMHQLQPEVVLPKALDFAVLEQGAEPRTQLRYVPPTKPTSYFVETSLRSRRLAAGTTQWSELSPELKVKTGVEIQPSSGPFTGRPLPGEALTKNDDAAAYLAGWNALGERRFALDRDDRGQFRSVHFADDPTNARSKVEREELVQRFLASTVPVPEQPVGRGAKWRVTWALFHAPAVVKQTATYTLEDITPQGWVVGVELQRIGDAQTLLTAPTPTDANLELIALVRKYAGRLTVRKDELLPTGSLTVTSTLHVRMHQKRAPDLEEIAEDAGTVTFTTGS
ncbi:MAG: hypothetical protein SFX73_29915 [Kofleriaceae bacterium]|nr:hypothetical protein [Kofleriaceae bacterium]